VLMQSAHRTTGIIAVTALVVHVTTKLAMERITVIDLFIPFMARNQTLYVGFGTLAGFFMMSVLWTGIVRARFAGRGKPWMWRSLHSVAYLAWPIALVHGLSAGRAAANWVIVSYIVCVLFVLVALAVRLSVSLGRRKNFSSTSTGSLKPVGKLVPTVAPSAKRTKRRSERPVEVAVEPISAHVVADRGNAPAAVVEQWSSVADAGPVAPVSARPSSVRPVSVAPVSAMPVSSRPVSARPGRADEDDYRPARGRYDRDDEPAAPRRRYAEPEARYADEEHTASRRRYVEVDDGYEAPRRRYAEPDARYDEVPAQRSRPRYDADEEPVAPRSRRYVEADEPYEVPRRRRAAEEPRPAEAPRRRWSGDDEPLVPRSRSTELERYSDGPRRRASRYAEQEEPAPRGRRYADETVRYDDVPAPATATRRTPDGTAGPG
jgi:DMSO/TMAO reductase YedYZ heme-binding membrane subunit